MPKQRELPRLEFDQGISGMKLVIADAGKEISQEADPEDHVEGNGLEPMDADARVVRKDVGQKSSTVSPRPGAGEAVLLYCYFLSVFIDRLAEDKYRHSAAQQ